MTGGASDDGAFSAAGCLCLLNKLFLRDPLFRENKLLRLLDKTVVDEAAESTLDALWLSSTLAGVTLAGACSVVDLVLPPNLLPLNRLAPNLLLPLREAKLGLLAPLAAVVVVVATVVLAVVGLPLELGRLPPPNLLPPSLDGRTRNLDFCVVTVVVVLSVVTAGGAVGGFVFETPPKIPFPDCILTGLRVGSVISSVTTSATLTVEG